MKIYLYTRIQTSAWSIAAMAHNTHTKSILRIWTCPDVNIFKVLDQSKDKLFCQAQFQLASQTSVELRLALISVSSHPSQPNCQAAQGASYDDFVISNVKKIKKLPMWTSPRNFISLYLRNSDARYWNLQSDQRVDIVIYCLRIGQFYSKFLSRLKSGHRTARVCSFMTAAMKLPRSAVSWPLFVKAENRP